MAGCVLQDPERNVEIVMREDGFGKASDVDTGELMAFWDFRMPAYEVENIEMFDYFDKELVPTLNGMLFGRIKQ